MNSMTVFMTKMGWVFALGAHKNDSEGKCAISGRIDSHHRNTFIYRIAIVFQLFEHSPFFRIFVKLGFVIPPQTSPVDHSFGSFRIPKKDRAI